MTLIQTTLRRLFLQQAPVASKGPLPLKPEQMKAVSGGTGGQTDSPFRSW